MRRSSHLLLALLAALVLVACGDDGGDTPRLDEVSPEAAPTATDGGCPPGVNVVAEAADGESVTLSDPTTAFAERIEDDDLYGDHYSIVLADFAIEAGDTITTEGGGRAVGIEVYNRDLTLPAPGTFDFEGQQNTYFQPTFYAGGTARPVTTVGEGGSLTITAANDQELCGSIDVSDGAVTISGTFTVPVVIDLST